MEQNVTDSTQISISILNTLIDKINDREIFMKGINDLYYYEDK